MPRNKYPEVTVNRILDTSMKLFMSKGYEHTTIQDIVNELGNLSKGAIYHHFKSKEEIMDAVSGRILNTEPEIRKIALDGSLNGLEKLKTVLAFSVSAARQEAMAKLVPSFIRNPQILALHMRDTMSSAANLIAPIVEEGVGDGSIKTDQPRELAEMILIFFNVWVNPWIYTWTEDELTDRFRFMKNILDQMGVPVLSEDILEEVKLIFSMKPAEEETEG